MQALADRVRARGRALGLDYGVFEALLQPTDQPAAGAPRADGVQAAAVAAAPSPTSSSGTAPEPRSLVYFHDCQ